MPGTWFTTNGPGGTLPEYCCTPLTYSATEDGTTDEALSVDTGNVTRSGRNAKFLPHWMPATRTERDQFKDEVMVSPKRRVRIVSWSDRAQYVS
ncbi:hypothetical protein G6F57_021458 [Rhizopus arrhizus]|nr:hypothetical protein G6F57_021458 [Rhizopus arrhizus]